MNNIVLATLLAFLCSHVVLGALTEAERIQQWRDKGNVWPPDWHYESDEYKNRMADREKEIMSLTGADERWGNWLQFTQSRLLPRLHETGFAVVQMPMRAFTRLKAKLEDAVTHLDSYPDEASYLGAYHQKPPKVVDVGKTLDDLQTELKSVHEEFAGGISLTRTATYGMLVTSPGSSTVMHYEHVNTHVVSSILHVGHEGERWPVDIEDHEGVLHSITLEPGQMLIYEGAKCLHGRRRESSGRFDATLFLHYKPSDPAVWSYTIDDVVSSVPPHWQDGVTERRGSRNAGLGITIDSRVVAGAPARVTIPDLVPDTPAVGQPTLTEEALREGYALPAAFAGTLQSPFPWPWPHETEAWKENMAQRERDLLTLTGRDERWENFMLYTQGRLVPRFTPRGFEVVPTPAHIQQRLKAHLDAALQNTEGLRTEPMTHSSYRTIDTKMVDVWADLNEIHRELLPVHEEWIGNGIKLQPTNIYGIRVNRNGSALALHYDKVRTHVISSIIHIDHEYYNNSQPWPIEIEDHDGVLHSMFLEPGQTLMYESAACLHGRRRVLNGPYYASVFAHYQPVDPAVWNYTIADVVAHVPKHWNEGILEEKGSRYAGQALTIDSRIADNAPPRIIKGIRVNSTADYFRLVQEQALGQLQRGSEEL